MNNQKIRFFLLGRKGFETLHNLHKELLMHVDCVVIGRDNNILNDYSTDIEELCKRIRIKYVYNEDYQHDILFDYAFAIGWRWMIDCPVEKLIIFHDSILPQKRGYNPLVTALINGDTKIGVTALFGSIAYDEGPIIYQDITSINYPIKINDAINLLSKSYSKLTNTLLYEIIHGVRLKSRKQIEKNATYSLWRNGEDYLIDWTKTASSIKRFIDATGYPYLGAATYLNGQLIRILDAEVIEDVKIENRDVGKLIYKEKEVPVVVCGKGLIRINEARNNDLTEQILFDKNFRIRFKGRL